MARTSSRGSIDDGAQLVNNDRRWTIQEVAERDGFLVAPRLTESQFCQLDTQGTALNPTCNTGSDEY